MGLVIATPRPAAPPGDRFARMDSAAIRRLEELADRAWPPFEVERRPGWEARFSHGMHRRLNSATVWTAADLPGTVERLERWYRDRGMPAIFKLTGASAAGLDDHLAAAGYRPDARVSIMTAPVSVTEPPAGVLLSPKATPEWRDAFAAISGYGPRRHRRLAELLDRIGLPAAYAAVRAGGRIVATGLAVAEGGHAGLYEMATDPAHRGRGLAGRIRDGLLAWMTEGGVTTAYLQVLVGNRPAERLYRSAGFEPRYEYWYRIEPGSSTDRPPVA